MLGVARQEIWGYARRMTDWTGLGYMASLLPLALGAMVAERHVSSPEFAQAFNNQLYWFGCALLVLAAYLIGKVVGLLALLAYAYACFAYAMADLWLPQSIAEKQYALMKDLDDYLVKGRFYRPQHAL